MIRFPVYGITLAASVTLVVSACDRGDHDSVAVQMEPEPTPIPATDRVINLDSLPVWELEETLRIGSMDDPDIGFSRIQDIEVAADGTLYVLEEQDRQVRAYDADGNLLWRVGGRGSGPGELQSASAMGLIGDTIWVRDGFTRFNFYTPCGEPLRTARSRVFRVDHPDLARESRGIIYRTTTPLPDGHLLAEPSTESAERLQLRRGIHHVYMPLLKLDEDGSVVDTIGWRWTPRSLRVTIGGTEHNLRPNEFEPVPYRVAIAYGDTITVFLPRERSDGLASSVMTRVAQGDTVFAVSLLYSPSRYCLREIMVGILEMRDVPSSTARRAIDRVDYPVPPDIQAPIQMPRAPGWSSRVRDPVLTPGSIWFPRGRDWLVVDLSAGPVAWVMEAFMPRTHDGERFWTMSLDRETYIPFVWRNQLNRDSGLIWEDTR